MTRVLAITTALFFVGNALGMEPEPNWTNRFQEIRKTYLDSFRQPSIGSSMTIQKRIGGDVSGILESVTGNYVVVSGVRYEASQLTDETCSQLFAGIYAMRRARVDIMREREAYQKRLLAEPKAVEKQALVEPLSIQASTPPPPTHEKNVMGQGGSFLDAVKSRTDRIGIPLLVGIVIAGCAVFIFLSKLFGSSSGPDVKCQQCGAMMKRAKKAERSLGLQLVGILLFLLGLGMLVIVPIGTIAGLILMIGSARLGYSKKKVWKCSQCGYFFERA